MSNGYIADGMYLRAHIHWKEKLLQEKSIQEKSIPILSRKSAET